MKRLVLTLNRWARAGAMWQSEAPLSPGQCPPLQGPGL